MRLSGVGKFQGNFIGDVGADWPIGTVSTSSHEPATRTAHCNAPDG